MVNCHVLRVSLVACLLFQLTSAMLMEDELTTCMQSTTQSDYCNGIYVGTFYQLDSNDDGFLSPEERSILYETSIDTVVLPNFFPEGSEECTYEQFCDAMLVVQFPDMSGADVDAETMEYVCEMETMAVQDTCEIEWLALFPSRVPYAGASADAETSGVSMSKTEYRQIVMNLFNPLDGPTWSIDEFLEFINPQNDHGTLQHFNTIVEAAHDGQLSVVPVDAYTESVNNCQVARRELIFGVFIAKAVGVVLAASVIGATVQTVFGRNQNFAHNLVGHFITNMITTLGCGAFRSGGGCMMSGALGGYVGGAAICEMGGDNGCWDLHNRHADIAISAGVAPVPDLAVAAVTSGALAGAVSHVEADQVDVLHIAGSRFSYVRLEGHCISGYNDARHHHTTREQCATLCDQDPSCKSFDWRSAHYGYNCAISHARASEVGNAFDSSCSMWSYNEKNTIQNYRHRANYAIGGHNVATYHGKNQNECAQLCNRNSRCQSFDWRPYSGYNCALNSVKCPHSHCGASDPTGWDGHGAWDHFDKTD